MSGIRKRTCTVCGLKDGHTLVDCPYKCEFCGDSVRSCECQDSSLVGGIMSSEKDNTGDHCVEDNGSEQSTSASSDSRKRKGDPGIVDGGESKKGKGKKSAWQTKFEEAQDEIAALREHLQRTEELNRKREQELQDTVNAMRQHINELEVNYQAGTITEKNGGTSGQEEENSDEDEWETEDEIEEDFIEKKAEERSKKKAKTKAGTITEKNGGTSGQEEENSDEDEWETEDEIEEDFNEKKAEERSKKKAKTKDIVSGLNLGGIHERYRKVLSTMVKKNCTMAQAMRECSIARNTLRDFIGLCELKIVDNDRYQTVVNQERQKTGKPSVKKIEISCRAALKDYRAQTNRLKEEKKLLPFFPSEEFYKTK